jgi:hypothetical protein
LCSCSDGERGWKCDCYYCEDGEVVPSIGFEWKGGVEVVVNKREGVGWDGIVVGTVFGSKRSLEMKQRSTED